MSHETNHNILDQIEKDPRISKALRGLDSKQDDYVKNPLKAFIKTLSLDNPSETRELENADVETEKLKRYYDTIAFVGIFMIPEAVRCGGSSQAADEIENELIKTAKKAVPHLNRETEEFYRNTFRALVEKLADEEFLPTFFRAHNIEKKHIYSGATVLDDALVTMDAAYEYGDLMGALSASKYSYYY